MAITDNLGFYIGNPGSTIADVLHRPTVIPERQRCQLSEHCSVLRRVSGRGRVLRGDMTERRYRVSKRPGGKWFGTLSYTYSRLTRKLRRIDEYRSDRRRRRTSRSG